MTSGPDTPHPDAPAEVLSEIARIAAQDLELRPMLQRITDTLAARFDWELVALVGIDRDGNHFECEALTCELETEVFVGYRRALGSGIVGRAAATGESIVVDDAQEVEDFIYTLPGAISEICVPVRHQGEVVGLLNVESLKKAAFADRLELLEAVARQIAGTVACARLHHELQRQTRALQILNQVSNVALAPGDLHDRLHAAAGYLRARFDLALVAIVVSNEEGTEWEHQAVVQIAPVYEPPRSRWTTSSGIIGRAIRTGVTQLVPDVSSDPDFLSLRPDVEAELVVPLFFHERTIGAVNFEATSIDLFDDLTVGLLETVGRQLTGTIELAVINEQLAASRADLERANRALRRQAKIDGLTGVANRLAFDEALELEWRRAGRSGEPIAVALFDIDYFKLFNDSYGHLAGDETLQRVARALASGLQRAGELVARFGGEEFAAVLPATERDDAERLTRELCRRVETLGIPHERSRVADMVTVSAGVASVVPPRNESPNLLVAMADEALYGAKDRGRNRVVVAAAPPIGHEG